MRSSQSFTGRREKWKTRAKRRFVRIWRHSAGSKAFGGCAKATRNASEWPRARCCSSKSSKIQLRSSKQPLFEARKLWSLYLGQKSNRSQPSSSLKRPPDPKIHCMKRKIIQNASHNRLHIIKIPPQMKRRKWNCLEWRNDNEIAENFAFAGVKSVAWPSESCLGSDFCHTDPGKSMKI